jgi:hypothetical protein
MNWLNYPKPYDPMCERYAENMTDYDSFIPGTISPQKREIYVIQEEGTYNKTNGHFLCDTCYIKAGMPTKPYGWKCP